MAYYNLHRSWHTGGYSEIEMLEPDDPILEALFRDSIPTPMDSFDPPEIPQGEEPGPSRISVVVNQEVSEQTTVMEQTVETQEIKLFDEVCYYCFEMNDHDIDSCQRKARKQAIKTKVRQNRAVYKQINPGFFVVRRRAKRARMLKARILNAKFSQHD